MREAEAPLRAMIEKVTGHLKEGLVESEADVEQYVLNPLLDCLGWDPASPSAVRRQYSPKGGKNQRLDYVLFSKDGAPAVVVEVKRPGLGGKADTRGQLLVYAADREIRLGLSTDGWTWSFYLPLSGGTNDAKLIRTVDLRAAGVDAVSGTLHRYLSCDRIRDGRAQAAAEEDRISRFIRSGWDRLLRDDRQIVNLIAKAARSAAEEAGVRNLKGPRLHEPTRRFVKGGFEFPAGSEVGDSETGSTSSKPRSDKREPRENPASRPPRQRHTGSSTGQPPFSPLSASSRRSGSAGSSESRKSVRAKVAWTYRGERRTEKNPTELFVAVIGRLHDDGGGTDFYLRLQARIRGRKRANLADSAVGTGDKRRPRLLPGGWYITTNLTTPQKLFILARAAEVAGISFDADGSNPGADLIVDEGVQSEREALRQEVRPPGAGARGAAWTYRGERRTERNPTALFLAVIGRLHDDCGGTDFYVRLQARIRGRKRANLADSAVGTGVPERFIRSLPGGWYTHTNLPTKAKLAFLARAAEVAGISFDADGSNPGADLIVEVKPKSR